MANSFLETFLRDCLFCHKTTLCNGAKEHAEILELLCEILPHPFSEPTAWVRCFLLYNQQPLQSSLPLPTAWALNLNPSSCVSGSSCPGVLADTSFFHPVKKEAGSTPGCPRTSVTTRFAFIKSMVARLSHIYITKSSPTTVDVCFKSLNVLFILLYIPDLVHSHFNVKYNVEFTEALSTGKKSDRAKCEETVLQQFFAIWGIAIMEVLSQAGNRSHNSSWWKKK